MMNKRTEPLQKVKGVMLLLTYRCNLNCVYCYESKKQKKEMSLEVAKDFITRGFEDSDQYDITHCHLMGGEPLLRFDLIQELVERTVNQKWSKPFLFVGPTNGALLNVSMRSWFRKNIDIVKMGLSFDGTLAMQDRNRTQSSQMVDWRFFLEIWPDNAVKITMSSQSINSMYDGVLYLHHLGLSKVNVELAHGVGWTKENIISYKTQLERLADCYVEHPEVHRISLLNIDIRKVLGQYVPNKKCGSGSNFSVIPNGEVLLQRMWIPK